MADIDPESYERDIARLLRLMAPEEKAPEAEYARRLERCRQCELLLDATCQACGCYVELRAAARGGKCPHRKW